MLMLTRDAAEAIKEISSARGADGVRISAADEAATDAGPGLQIALADSPQDQDSVVDAEGAHIFLAPEAAEALDDKVLDARVEQGEVSFAILLQEGGEGAA